MAHEDHTNRWGEAMANHVHAPPTNDFASGDHVQLRSGGPTMIVTAVRPEGLVDAMWFWGGAPTHDAFPAAGLRRVTKWDLLCMAFGGR